MADDARVLIRPAPFNAETADAALAAEITPAGSHFVRTNFGVLTLDAAAHRVHVGGAVREPLVLDVDALRALPRREVSVTLECAGNDRLSIAPLPAGELWGGGAVGTALWGGVSLRDVLHAAGAAPDALEVLVEGADSGRVGADTIAFARSIPLAKALHPDTLLALEMNGEPLPPEHGAPVRLVVPGWYGMASVKWVRRIELLTEPFRGHFQRERYVFDLGDGAPAEPVRVIAVKAVLTSPRHGASVPLGPVRVCGWAWSGAGPIARVEVAVDGGDEWREARLFPAASSFLWQRWEYDWDAAEPGRHTLRARAHDQAGRVQPAAPRWNRLGYGANAVRSVVVTAR